MEHSAGSWPSPWVVRSVSMPSRSRCLPGFFLAARCNCDFRPSFERSRGCAWWSSASSASRPVVPGGWELACSLGFTPHKPERRPLQRGPEATAQCKRKTWPALKKRHNAGQPHHRLQRRVRALGEVSGDAHLSPEAPSAGDPAQLPWRPLPLTTAAVYERAYRRLIGGGIYSALISSGGQSPRPLAQAQSDAEQPESKQCQRPGLGNAQVGRGRGEE